MKSITRLYLSKSKQKALSALHRIGDARNSLGIGNHLKRSIDGNADPAVRISLRGVIEDRGLNNLRIDATIPWAEGDELACTATPAFGAPEICKTFIIAKHAVSRQGDNVIEDDEHPLTRLLLTIKIPKRITAYEILLINASAPDIRCTFVLSESAYARMLHENGMLVLTAEHDCSYPEWFDTHRTHDAELEAQRLADFEENPIFSIIVPLFKTPIGFFDDMIGSVLGQTYPYWQLILVNASPEMEELGEAVGRFAAQERRVTVVNLDENLGITLNTNAGIEAAIGDFICFFDHDDTIEPDILFEYAKAINEHPETDVLYCDEDKLTPNGEFMHPFFKPDYSPDLLYCHNYICHMLAVRTSIIAGFEPAGADVDGAQDYNCVLRASEKARHIHHVRRILYHWRINPTSVASDSGNKPYATYAGQLALERHFERLGMDVRIGLRHVPFRYNARYRVKGEPLASIVIPSHDDGHLLEGCICSIAGKTTYGNYEIVVVDRGSTEARTLAYYESLDERRDSLRVVHLEQATGEAAGIAQALNFGAAQAQGEYLVFLSPDTEIITPDWLAIMLGYLQREEVGCVGARIWCADDTILHAGIAIGGGGVHYLNQDGTMGMVSYFGLRDDVQNMSAVSASCMATRKSLFVDSEGFDMAIEEGFQGIDYCLRAYVNGKFSVYTPFAEVYRHNPYPSFGCEEDGRLRAGSREPSCFKQRWASYYTDGDPFFSVNFQQQGPGARYYHLRRDEEVDVVLGRHGLAYRVRNGKPNV